MYGLARLCLYILVRSTLAGIEAGGFALVARALPRYEYTTRTSKVAASTRRAVGNLPKPQSKLRLVVKPQERRIAG